MKRLVCSVCVLLLSACSALPTSRLSFGGDDGVGMNAANPNDPRMHHRAFYSDGDSTPRWMKEVPRSNE